MLLVEVSGSTFGAVWGDSEVVTDDSSLATAAVQFGVLKPGERGMIKVTICPAKKKYAGFSQHGVTSQPWDNAGPYVSLKIEAAPAGAFQACHDTPARRPAASPFTLSRMKTTSRLTNSSAPRSSSKSRDK